MKILSLAQIDMSQTDARVVHLFGIAKAFRQIGASVDVIVISSSPSNIVEKGLSVYVLPKCLTWWLIEGIICNIFAWFIILLKGHLYDRIYIRHHSNLALAARFFPWRIPLWLEINSLFSDEELFHPRFWGTPLRLWVGTFLERLAFKKASHLFCVTQELKDKIIKLYAVNHKKITVLSNGVDIEAYRPMNKIECRRQLGLEETALYIGFIGNFIGWSGIDTFLNAIPHIIKRYEKLKFIIVGAGEYFTKYVELSTNLGLKNNVIFPGQVHKDMAPVWINTFDIGISLTKPKGHGLSPIKNYCYMACGIPILGSDLPGFESIKQYNTGLLVPYNNLEIIQSALERLINDEKLRQEMGKNGRRCAEKLFSWQIIAKKIITA